MDEAQGNSNNDALADKIARLVQERGWNQEEFARITRLNRHTVRQILLPGEHRRLRNATIGACARALGLTVHELRMLPLDRLLPRMNEGHPANGVAPLRRLYEKAKQPELVAWIERNAERARQLSDGEVDELLTLQESLDALNAIGVEGFVERLERRRRLVQQVYAIAATEYRELLEQFVGLLHEKVQPAHFIQGAEKTT
jgi:transcriptional regulator with XRE-family HTH domain